MNKRIFLSIPAVFLFVSEVALAAHGGGAAQTPEMFMPGMALDAPGRVTILSPADGTMVESGFTFKLRYKAVADPNSDHLHLDIDGKPVAMIHVHQLNGATDVWPLSPGKHQVCLSIHTKDHKLIGFEQCISVIYK